MVNQIKNLEFSYKERHHKATRRQTYILEDITFRKDNKNVIKLIINLDIRNNVEAFTIKLRSNIQLP